METWQTVICSYGGAAILLGLFYLLRYNKLSAQCAKNNDYSPMRRFIFSFIMLFLLIIGAMVAHIGYLSGVVYWPILVLLGITIAFAASALWRR